MRRDQTELSPNEVLLLTMAHDLRNPLATLQQLAYLMEHHYDPKHVARIKGQLVLCESVVNNVLALAGLSRSEKTSVSLPGLIEDVLSLSLIPPPVRISLTAAPVKVWSDRSQLIQALLNLFHNAVQSIGEGEGTIRIVISEIGPTGCLRISDSGPGFPSSVLQSGFRPVASAKKNGIGIGLAAAHRMIEANEGRIVLENLPGRGACCSIFLPLNPGSI